jgi:hypothetical protein
MTQLTVLAPERLRDALDAFARGIANDALASSAFARIRSSADRPADERMLLDAALTLARRFAIPLIDEEPAQAFSWDGRSLRTRSEACVVFHEIAHWQLAPPDRRTLKDFGLGTGPETGRKEEADRDRVVDEETRIDEECAASLLGILWEAENRGPGLDAFLEQNWLESFDSEGTHRLFGATLRDLLNRGAIDGTARPIFFANGPGALNSGTHAVVFTGVG